MKICNDSIFLEKLLLKYAKFINTLSMENYDKKIKKKPCDKRNIIIVEIVDKNLIYFGLQ